MSICCLLPGCINSVGLAFDIAGVILLYFYGLSGRLNTPGGQVIVFSGESPEDAEERKRYTRWSRLGLFLIVFGFVLQIISNWL